MAQDERPSNLIYLTSFWKILYYFYTGGIVYAVLQEDHLLKLIT